MKKFSDLTLGLMVGLGCLVLSLGAFLLEPSGSSWLWLAAFALGEVAVVTPAQLSAALEELKGLGAQFKAENDRLLLEGKNTQTQWTEKLQKLGDRIDEIETKFNRPPVPVDQDLEAAGHVIARISKSARAPEFMRKWYAMPATERMARREAFETWCRKDEKGLSPDQQKLMTIGDDTTGGYLATPETTNEILKGVVEFSPLRSISRVRTTSAKSVKVRKRTGTFAAAWVAEAGTKAESTGLKYGLEEMPVHELYAYVKITNDDLEDSDFNLESELQMEAAEQFGVAEGLAFVSGSGVGKPEGILTNAAVATTNSGHATLLTADGLIDLFYAVKDSYAKNGVWAMKRSSIGSIRKLKDGQGNYLWQPGLAGVAPATLLERPYYEAVDMPAVGAGTKPIAFGDFKRGYYIVDRSQMTVLRDPFSAKNTGTVEFVFRRRVGAQVVVAEAIRTQTISA